MPPFIQNNFFMILLTCLIFMFFFRYMHHCDNDTFFISSSARIDCVWYDLYTSFSIKKHFLCFILKRYFDVSSEKSYVQQHNYKYMCSFSYFQLVVCFEFKIFIFFRDSGEFRPWNWCYTMQFTVMLGLMGKKSWWSLLVFNGEN